MKINETKRHTPSMPPIAKKWPDRRAQIQPALVRRGFSVLRSVSEGGSEGGNRA